MKKKIFCFVFITHFIYFTQKNTQKKKKRKKRAHLLTTLQDVRLLQSKLMTTSGETH